MKVINLVNFYSKSFLLGFLDASLDKKPKVKRDTKNVTVVYTTIFNVNINLSPKLYFYYYKYCYVT